MKTTKLLILALNLFGLSYFSNASCLTADSLELVDFYNSAGGSTWTNRWILEEPVKGWYGVTLDAAECNVVCLDLDGVTDCAFTVGSSGNNVVADISAVENINLPALSALHLGRNKISGNLPNFDNFPSIETLDLSRNELSGSIPDFIYMPTLKYFYLRDNQLTGTLFNFTNLPELIKLNIGGNLLNGPLFDFATIPKLKYLYLDDCRFNGPVIDFTNLPLLERLYADKNQLSGDLPNFQNLPKLDVLIVGNNRLTGEIPDFRDVPLLRQLFLNNNEFTSAVIDFPTLTNLVTLDWSMNRLNFDDLIPMTTHPNHSSWGYAPQKFIGAPQYLSYTQEEAVTLHLSRQFGGSNTSITWYKESVPLTSPTLDDSTYTIASMQFDDIGTYKAYATNPTLPALTLAAAPIDCYIEGYDQAGAPVYTDQLIIEYDETTTTATIDSVRLELANNYQGKFIKSCNCDRKLELWTFDSTVNVLKIPIGPGEKHKQRLDGPEIDGDFNRNVVNVPDDGSIENWTWDNNNTSMTDSVSIYVLDSGIDTGNAELTQYLASSPNTDCDGGGEWGTNFTDTVNTQNIMDSLGHGTGVADLATRNLPQNKIGLKVLKVFDSEGNGELFNLLCALHKSIDEEADIINFSGGYQGDTAVVLVDAIQRAEDAGILLVVAAGNDSLDIDVDPYWPASCANENLIVVTAIDVNDDRPGFANIGRENVDLGTIGVGVEVMDIGGGTRSMTGTSASAPIVARALAQELSNSGGSWQLARESLFASLVPIPSLAQVTRLEAKLGISLECTEVYAKIQVLLEGPYLSSSGSMRTDLAATHQLLPGQTSGNFEPTPPYLPYKGPEWYYYGNEMEYLDGQGYPRGTVDWVLVSFRTAIAANTTVKKMAGLLMEDGNIRFLEPVSNTLDHGYDSLYIVVEHRNHLDVMSPQKVLVDGNYIKWDFTMRDGYTNNSTGQVLLSTAGIWGMAAGDIYQTVDYTAAEVNGSDFTKYYYYTGYFGVYNIADLNHDGTVDGADRVLLSRNNGLFSSVPK